MPTVTVTKSDASKKGAPRVYFDNKHDWKDAYYVNQKIQAPQVGQVIDANTASSDYQGKTYWYLNSWAPSGNGAAPATSNAPVARPKVAGWDIEPGDLSRLVSNIVGSAIEYGLCPTPESVLPWIAVGYRAGEQLRSGKVQDFADKLPDFGAVSGVNGPIDDGEPSF